MFQAGGIWAHIQGNSREDAVLEVVLKAGEVAKEKPELIAEEDKGFGWVVCQYT